jgi:hypothetical protein
MTDGAGLVFYGRSYDWSNTGIHQDKPQTTKFTLKAGSHEGLHSMVVSGAGVRSKALCVQLTAEQVAGQGAPADVPLQACAANQ